MTIQELKTKLEEIVHKKLYVSLALDLEDNDVLDKICVFLNKSDNLIEDLKVIISSKNNENYYAYDEYINQFLISLDVEKRINIIKNNDKYKDLIKDNNIYINIWNTLKDKEKLDYLISKSKYDEIDNLLLNQECKNTNNFKSNKLLKEIFSNDDIRKKIELFSLYLNYSTTLLNNINLNDYEFCSLLNKECYTQLLLKKCKSFKDFYNLYKNNHKIYNLLARNSLSFKNDDNEKIHDFILDNPNFVGKFNNKYLDLFSIIEISKLSKYKNLDSDAFATIIVRLYKYDNSKADEYFNKDNLLKCSKHSIDINPFSNLSVNIRNEIFNNYNLFNKFLDTIMIEAINESFVEDDIVNLLRNDTFVFDMSSFAIELMLNKLSFKASFNMLQRKNILAKVNHLNVEITLKDTIFIKGFLDSPILVNKSDHSMIFEMLKYLNDEEVLYYVTLPYLINKLSNYEIINICLLKKINIFDFLSNKVIIDSLVKNDIINFVNEYWKSNLDLSIFNDKNLCKLILNIDDKTLKQINFEEVNYLYETIRTKGVLSKQEAIPTISNYKCVLASYLTLGLERTILLVTEGNKDVTLDFVKKLQEEIVQERIRRFKEENDAIFNNMATQVIDNLLQLERTNDIVKFAKIIGNNTYLDNSIYILLENKYDDYNSILNKFYSFVNYYDENEELSKKDIINYINSFINKFIKRKENEYNDEFDKRILNNFKIKENVLFKKRKLAGKEFLTKLKLKVFIRALTEPHFGINFLKNNIDITLLKDNYVNYLRNNEQEFEDILEHVLIPLANDRLDYVNCLEHLGINKPANYDVYIKFNNDLKYVTILNNKINSLKKKYGIDEIISIMNYICYGTSLTFKAKVSEVKNFNKLSEIVNLIHGEVYIDKYFLKFIYNTNIDIYNIDEIIEYRKYNEIIDEIIKKTYKYINKVLDEVKVKNYYVNEYFRAVNIDNFDLKINNENYELRGRVFSLNDIEIIFNGFEFGKKCVNKDLLLEFLFNKKNLVMVVDGYYESLVDNLGVIISKWDEIIDYVKILNEDIYSLSLIQIENILQLISFKNDILFNTLDKDLIRSLFNFNYYEIDLNDRYNLLIKLYKESYKQVLSSLPYLCYREEKYCVKFIDKYSQDYLKPINNSVYRVGAIGNELLTYSLLSKNGCQLGIYVDDELVAKVIGVRNGNTLYLNSIESNIKVSFINVIKNFGKELINIMKDDSDSIDFITIVNNYYFNDENGLKIDTTLCPIIGYPIRDDYKVSKNNVIFSNYADNVSTLVASNKVVDKNNFKYYDIEAKYLRKRNDIIKLSNNVNDEYLNKISKILYIYRELNNECIIDINYNNIGTIYLGDDFVLFIQKDGYIEKFVLPFDERANEEIKIILENMKKEKSC